MSVQDAAAWVARGREHQQHGRIVDALLCYRRAARTEGSGADAALYMGETYWQLGMAVEAVAAWRDAVRLAPAHLGARHALTESLIEIGDMVAAGESVRAALGLDPDSRWARAYGALIDLLDASAAMVGDRVSESWRRFAAVLESDPAWVPVATFSGSLAAALDRAPHDPAVAAVRERLLVLTADAKRWPQVPAALLAVCAESAAMLPVGGAAPVFALAAGRPYAVSELRWLRRVAYAAARAGAPEADSLGREYARLALQEFAPGAPLVWPRRTAALRPRVVLLVDAGADAAPAVRTALEAIGRRGGGCELMIASIGGHELPPYTAQSPGDLPATTVALASEPGIDDARRIASFDADLLVDCVGLAAPVAALLAARPARRLVAFPGGAHPHVAPLLDSPPGPDEGFDALLAVAAAGLDTQPRCELDAGAMAAMWNEAVGAHRAGDLPAALDGYARVLDSQPGFAPAAYLRAVAAAATGDGETARIGFAAALAAAPGYDEARVAAAKAALDRGEADAAVALCEEGLAAGRPSAAVWRALGLAQLARRDGDKAAACFAQALGFAPRDAETHYNFGVALQMQRQFGEAARAYQRALFFDPKLAAADFNLGVLFQEQGNDAAAIAAYENVLRANPRQAAAYKNLGEVLFSVGRIDRWLANFERFEAHCPNALPLAVQALEACQYLADFQRLERYLDGLRNERFAAADEFELVDCLEQILYLLLFFDVEPEMLSRFAVTYDAAARRVYGEPFAARASRRPGRIRVGYLSADLRDHVMGKMAWSAVEHSDKSRFELHFYSLDRREDAWTTRFRGLADGFVAVAEMSAAAAARRIADDDLDILVDLQTHTRGARPEILALKPARVQITHVASAGAVGLAAIDFKLTDRYADVPENQETMVERLLPMDGCVYPYRVLEPATESLYQRPALGLPADAFVVGAFVTGMKLSRRCLDLWREVLDRIPRARIAFSPANAALRTQYLRLVRSAGIAEERVVFVPQGRGEAENLARYRLVDVVLDPMPFGGVNGTLEALAMGVPVVTLVGKKHGERTSYSILVNLGVEATIAQSGREYVELAVRLATDAVFAGEVRAAIRSGLAGSRLTDRVAHTRALEQAYLVALAERSPEALAGLQPAG